MSHTVADQQAPASALRLRRGTHARPAPRRIKIFFEQTQIHGGKNRDSSLMFEFSSYVTSKKNPGSSSRNHTCRSRRLPGPSSYVTYLLRPAAIDNVSYVSSKTFFVDRRKWSSCAASLRMSHTCSIFRTSVSSHHSPCRTPSAGHRSPYVSYEELPGRLGSPSQSLKSPMARVSMCHTAITRRATDVAEVLDFLSNFW